MKVSSHSLFFILSFSILSFTLPEHRVFSYRVSGVFHTEFHSTRAPGAARAVLRERCVVTGQLSNSCLKVSSHSLHFWYCPSLYRSSPALLYFLFFLFFFVFVLLPFSFLTRLLITCASKRCMVTTRRTSARIASAPWES